MTMTLNDILYTPLDCPPVPSYNLDELKIYMDKNKGKNQFFDFLNRSRNIAERDLKEQYPWNLTVIYFNMFNSQNGWLDDFDKKFPGLPNYITGAFGVPLSHIGVILLLHVKNDQEGVAFWHNDPDPFGMRLYLNFDRIDKNKLILRKTKIPYNKRIDLNLDLCQEEIHECKLLHSQQCFYLNNVRAMHAVYTEVPNVDRITALIIPKPGLDGAVNKMIEDLVIRSANNHKDLSILY